MCIYIYVCARGPRARGEIKGDMRIEKIRTAKKQIADICVQLNATGSTGAMNQKTTLEELVVELTKHEQAIMGALGDGSKDEVACALKEGGPVELFKQDALMKTVKDEIALA